MSKTVLKRYAPFYISVLATGLVMVFLFLRPDSVLGLQVEVDTPLNNRNNLFGFKLAEEVVITARVKLQGAFEDITEVNLAIEQTAGSPGFIPITGATRVLLPLVVVTGDNLTDQLPVVGGKPQGALTGDLVLNKVRPDAFGYGYGYLGEAGVGQFEYILRYKPPPIPGDYKATVSVVTPNQTVSFPTEFSVLGALTAIRLSTIFPISDTEALSRDLVILQIDTSAVAKDIASVTVFSGDLLSTDARMVAASAFHPAVQEKWGVASAAEFLLPFTVPDDPDLTGDFFAFVRVEDSAGQVVNLNSAATAPKVTIGDTREIFNVYLMPDFSFITPPLQCASPPALAALCTGDQGDEYDVVELLKQTVPRSKLNLAFNRTIPGTAPVPLNKIVQSAFVYDAAGTPPGFKGFIAGIAQGRTLDKLSVGRGYVIKTTGDEITGPFKRILDTGDAQFPATAIPLPIKLTFTGKVVADPTQLLSETKVETRWNLVGAHSERDTTVGVFLAPLNILGLGRTWEQLFSFQNTLDIKLDNQGLVRLSNLEAPITVLVQQVFRNLFRDSDTVKAGGGHWLFMCESPPAECTGGKLRAVLE